MERVVRGCVAMFVLFEDFGMCVEAWLIDLDVDIEERRCCDKTGLINIVRGLMTNPLRVSGQGLRLRMELRMRAESGALRSG